MMQMKPITTLFMLMSVDGKISTGCSDYLDFDADLPLISGVSEGLNQYYEIEKTTDLWSLNSGRVHAKLGVNEKPMPTKTAVSFVLVDNNHLTEHGIRYFCAKSNKFVLITTNAKHPAFEVCSENMHIILQDKLCMRNAFAELYKMGCTSLTIQTGGTLNGLILREGLFDYVDIVVAPVLVGGRETSTLIDGESIADVNELNKLSALTLIDVSKLNDSYIRMRYKVINNIKE